MKLDINTDQIVGLVLEFAESHHLNTEAIKDMNSRYDVGEPTEEEKIEFLRVTLALLPATSYLTELVSQFLNVIDEGEESDITARKVKSYLLPNGGLVSVYAITSNFYIASFDDNTTEEWWGCGSSAELALRHAADEWKKYNEDEDVSENPFVQVVKSI